MILRVLPYWLREPLLIAVGLFFGCLGLYWFAVVGGWGRAAVGVLFLALAALRAHVLRSELRSRRTAKEAA